MKPLTDAIRRLGYEPVRPPPAPIPIILFCPNCGMQHVDAPDPRFPNGDPGGGDLGVAMAYAGSWKNPPQP